MATRRAPPSQPPWARCAATLKQRGQPSQRRHRRSRERGRSYLATQTERSRTSITASANRGRS
eukprot:5462483-Pyramimonas_sp.AAC.1